MPDTSFPVIPDQVRKDLVQIMKLLSDDTRLRILLYLAEHGEVDVTTLCEVLEHSQPAVSHHLSLLRLGNLIQVRRDGKHNFYSVFKSRFYRIAEALLPAGALGLSELRFDRFVLTYDRNFPPPAP